MSDDVNVTATEDHSAATGAAVRPHELGFWDEFRDELLRGSPTLILLVALTAIVHHFDWIPSNDAWFARLVAPYVPLDDGDTGAPLVQVVEVDAAARAMAMERTSSGPLSIELQRTDGVRPIDRFEMVKFLNKIGMLLEKRHAAERPVPGVIGIDVDLAPLESDPKGSKGGSPTTKGDAPSPYETAMTGALDALRAYAPVVVITGNRPADERARRNAFMRNVGCTKPGSLATDSQGRKGLYFASPALFAVANEAPFRFVSEAKLAPRPGTTPAELPAIFPSLGTLMFLALPAAAQNRWSSWWGPHPYRFQHADDIEKQDALVEMCRQATSHGPGGEGDAILQDHIANGPGANPFVAAIGETYRRAMYNWRLLDGFTVSRTVLNGDDLAAPRLAHSDTGVAELQIGDARALLISVAGVGSIDHYFVPYLPSSSEQWPSGAMLHGLTIASLTQGIGEHWGWGLLIDFLVGFAFLMSSAAINPWIEKVPEDAPFSRKALQGLVPLLLAVGLGTLSLRVSAWALEHDVWFNPVFVLLGLAVHAYIEPWCSTKGAGHPTETWKERFSFGATRAVRAFAAPAVLDAGKHPTTSGRVDALVQVAVMLGILIVVVCVFVWEIVFHH